MIFFEKWDEKIDEVGPVSPQSDTCFWSKIGHFVIFSQKLKHRNLEHEKNLEQYCYDTLHIWPVLIHLTDRILTDKKFVRQKFDRH
jgi:hypothetical protein